MNEEHVPSEFTTEQWYTHTRTWRSETYCDARASVVPEQAKARQAGAWEITVVLGDMTLAPGDHVAVELNVTWRTDLGRPYIFGRRSLETELRPGYSATPKFVMPEGVECRVGVAPPERMARYFIIDGVVTSGTLGPGASFRVFLADPESTLLRCPWFAQDVPIPVAIRKADEPFYRRLKEIPVVHVVGGAPKLWKVAGTLQPDHKTARIQAIAADIENLNPTEFGAEPEVLPSDALSLSAFKRESGYHGAPVWRATAAVPASTVARIEVLNRDAGLYGRSNPVLPLLHENMQIYFGDLHGQSDRSIGFGTEEEYFWWARDAELLDFAAPANHYGGRETFSQELWRDTLKLCDDFDDPGRFITLYSYEWGVKGHEHRNVYYAEKPGRAFVKHEGSATSIGELWKRLDAQGLPVLTIPHHPKFIGGRMNWEEFHGKYQCLVEVCSIWGNSEQGGRHSVQAGLRLGHRVGVVGGTDTHFSQPGRPADGPFDLAGVTAVICDRLDRATVWNALRARRCYATTGERILLDFRVDGCLMGSEIPASGPRKITGRVVGTTELESVEVVRNNRVWQSIPVTGRDVVTFEFEDDEDPETLALEPHVPVDGRFFFYYLRATQRDRHWAMSSPIWVVMQA